MVDIAFYCSGPDAVMFMTLMLKEISNISDLLSAISLVWIAVSHNIIEWLCNDTTSSV